MGTRDIESLLRQKFPDHPWVREDIKNEVKKYRRGVLDGYTPTQALIRVFQDYDIKHSVLQVDGRVAALIWTYPWCQEMWARFPLTMSTDNTFKTNRFNMPFVNTTGITGMGTSFNIAFGLLSKEDEETYQWYFERLEGIRLVLGIELPRIIITDFEKASSL